MPGKNGRAKYLGLTRTNAVDKKKMYEAEFQKRVNANPQWKHQYGSLLNDLETAYDEFKPYGLARDYYLEITRKIELFTIAGQLNTLRNAKNNGDKDCLFRRIGKNKRKAG